MSVYMMTAAEVLPPKKSKLSAVLFLSGELLFTAAGFTACRTTPVVIAQQMPKAKFQAEPYYITPEDYEQIKGILWGTPFLGEKLVIMELTQQVEQMNILRGNEAVSFTAETMPKDLRLILQKYNNMKTGENFYSYVIDCTDRFILCPVLERASYPIAGLSFTKSNLHLLYPAENITFLNMHNPWNPYFLSAKIVAGIMVHEAAHHRLDLLIMEEKVSREYYFLNLTERYALIEEVEFLYALLQDTFKFAREYFQIEYYIHTKEEEIERYNSQLGLPEGDRTLLPR